MLKSAKDDISDDLLQWLPDANIRTGESTEIIDPLVAPDTWIHTLWAGHDYKYKGFSAVNFFKWDLYHQRLDKEEREVLGLRQRDYFFGLINKASFRFDLGLLWIEPRWKSEYRRQTLDLVTTNTQKREELAEIGGMILGFPLLSHTSLQGGVEFTLLNDIEGDADFNGIAAAVQFTNVSDYLGYRLTTQTGMKIDRRDPKDRDAVTITQGFISVYAGLE
jgi:hypothetical protein